MRISHLRVLAAFCVVTLAFGIGFVVRGWVSEAKLYGDEPLEHNAVRQEVPREDFQASLAEPQIDDAIQRWSEKSSMTQQRVRYYYEPRVMFIPTRNQGQGMLCVELHLDIAKAIGGSPVYCYRSDYDASAEENLTLLAEYSDVE